MSRTEGYAFLLYRFF